MNNKGQLSIVILVIGVFAVFTLALLSFFSSNITTRHSFIGVDLVVYTNFQLEEKIFLQEDVSGLYFETNETKFVPNFSLDWSKEELLFSVSYEEP